MIVARRRERAVRPRPELSAEAGAEELRDDAHVLHRQPEHLRQHAALVEDGLRGFVERQRRAVPRRGRRVQLDRVVRFGRRDVGLIDLHRRARERAVGVAALALQPRRRRERRRDDIRLVVGFQFGIDVVRLRRIRHLHRIGGGLGLLERVGDGERDVLAVIANDVVLERRAALVHDPFEAGPLHRARDLSDVRR